MTEISRCYEVDLAVPDMVQSTPPNTSYARLTHGIQNSLSIPPTVVFYTKRSKFLVWLFSYQTVAIYFYELFRMTLILSKWIVTHKTYLFPTCIIWTRSKSCRGKKDMNIFQFHICLNFLFDFNMFHNGFPFFDIVCNSDSQKVQ